MSAITITFQVDSDNLQSYSDEYLAQLWHIGQANPAPFGDMAACRFAERIGREIVRRWLEGQTPSLWHHQGAHAEQKKSDEHILGAATLRQFRAWLVDCQPQQEDRSPAGRQLADALSYLDGLATSFGHQFEKRGGQ